MDAAVLILATVNVLSLAVFVAVVYVLHRSHEAERRAQAAERDDVRRQVLLLAEHGERERQTLVAQFATERRMLLDRLVDHYEILIRRAADPEVVAVNPVPASTGEPISVHPDDDEGYWDARNGQGD